MVPWSESMFSVSTSFSRATRGGFESEHRGKSFLHVMEFRTCAHPVVAVALLPPHVMLPQVFAIFAGVVRRKHEDAFGSNLNMHENSTAPQCISLKYDRRYG